MRYDINDKSSAVYNIQRFLYYLSKRGYKIPVVYPDGIFGPDTTAAVRAFQAEQGIAQSGIVDFATFKILVNEYRSAQDKYAPPQRVRLFPRLLFHSSLHPGEKSALISLIQGMLRSIGSVYADIEDIEITGIYDERTERMINQIKASAGQEADSVIDKATYALIAGLYESFINDTM